jgi:enoyl-CoA hydratase/carnithine racemase
MTNLGKVYSAGGDLKAIYSHLESKAHDKAIEQFDQSMFFFEQARYSQSKIISIVDGLTIGGGLSTILTGALKVITPDTVFMMPEILAGYYPDAQVIYYYTKMRKNIGKYLLLTGSPLKGEDIVNLGLVDYIIPEDKKSILL